MSTRERNARFWAWLNGSPVKITLRPGECAQHYSRIATDEGFSSVAMIWVHVGDGVEVESHSRDRDCDGLLERESHGFASFDRLAVNVNEDEGVAYPSFDWKRRTQRDHYAEAMGY